MITDLLCYTAETVYHSHNIVKQLYSNKDFLKINNFSKKKKKRKTRQREKLNNNAHPMRPQPTIVELRTVYCPSGLSCIWSEWLGLYSAPGSVTGSGLPQEEWLWARRLSTSEGVGG